MENTANILVVDDRKENLFALEALLESPDLNIEKATSGNEALGLMLEKDFALILLDVQMPDMDGFEVAELMKKSEKTKYVPIIFMTAISKEEKYIFQGYETGAVDYLFKPLDPVILKNKVNVFLELHRHKKELEMSKLQIEKQNIQLKELSIRDGLTGLYNYRYFRETLKRQFALAKRNSSDISCFMIDLDYFKDVNDTFGHSFGDFVLRNFSQLLKSLIRESDILARYGGEEFSLLLPNTSLEGARVLAEKFRQKAQEYVYEENGYSRRVTASIGIASFAAHLPPSPTDLVIFADRALYLAKAEGRNRVKIYNEEAMAESAAEGMKPPSRDTLSNLKKRLKQMLEKTSEELLISMENLFQNPFQGQDQQMETFNVTKEHINKTLEILDLLGSRLGISEPLLQTFKRAARLHGFFRIYLCNHYLKKNDPPHKYYRDQAEVEDYALILDQFARLFNFFANEWTILRYHRENYDGSGHPEGLHGSQVPMGSRLLALANAFVTMTEDIDKNTNQPPRLTPEKVIEELEKGAGYQFDPLLVNLLLDIIEEYNLLKVPRELILNAKKKI